MSRRLHIMRRPALDDPALRAWRDQTLYRLLLRASRSETTSTLERIHRLGYADVSLTDTNLLANLDTGGTIISALARRAGVSRQAASQQVAALERAGYVERRASNTDGRAAVVFQTARGRALLDQALNIVAELEDAYAEHLGPSRLATLKKLLASLVERIDPAGALGRD
jgi:DNA-binding MarR family transcriptional regulator